LIRQLLKDSDHAGQHTALIEQASEQLSLRADDKRLAECLDWLTTDLSRSRGPGELAALAGLSRGLFARGRSLRATGLSTQRMPSGVSQRLREIVSTATEVARDTSQPESARIIALAVAANGEPAAIEKWISELVVPSQPQAVQSAAVWAAAQTNPPAIWNALFQGWPSHTRSTRDVLLAQALRSPSGINALVGSLEANILSAEELPSSMREALGQVHDEPLRRRLQPFLAAVAPADRSEVLARYSAITGHRGDPTRGAAIFKQHCQTCHAMQGIGQRVGPDLASVASRPDVVPRSNIEQLRATGKSIMPDGLEQKILPDQMADLLAFLHRADVSQLPTN
jgi:mono/diheme cytochrome c family protein